MATEDWAAENLSLMSLFDDVVSVPSSDSTDSEPMETPLGSNETVEESSSGWGNNTYVPFLDSKSLSLEKIQQGLNLQWARRHMASRYRKAIVLLLSWEDHDLGESCDYTIHQYVETFEYLYKYDVWTFIIPNKKPHLALTRELVRLAEEDSPETLFVIWYMGHGREHVDRRGSPRWVAKGEPESPAVDSSIVSTSLADCEADILLVNDCCCSLTCDRFNTRGVVESISASAFDTITYGSMRPDDVSPSMTWAALRILRDRKSVESGITVTELHRKICLAVQWGNDERPDIDGDKEDIVYWERTNTRTHPVYTRLSAEEPNIMGTTRSIVLGQLGREYFPDTNCDIPDFRVQIKVADPNRIDPKEWTDWLLSAPSGVNVVRLEEVKYGDQTVIPW